MQTKYEHVSFFGKGKLSNIDNNKRIPCLCVFFRGEWQKICFLLFTLKVLALNFANIHKHLSINQKEQSFLNNIGI